MTTISFGLGRTLGYRSYGDPDGRVVVNCHGGLVSGLDVAPFDATARELGICLVSPDRPGIGESSPYAGRTTGDWASDVEQLLDALAVEQASVFGWSMGGQYALACAALLPHRITSAVVVAGALPPDDPTMFAELNKLDQRLTRMCENRAWVAKKIFATMAVMAKHTPKLWLKSAHCNEPALATAAADACRSTHAMVEEYRAWMRPWGFAPEDIAVPTTMFQGDTDDLVPPQWADRLAARIPDARVVHYPGEGHFAGYAHQAEVLRETAPRSS
jgi:pimeloyl-ACP methyl ester carboxylesterase